VSIATKQLAVIVEPVIHSQTANGQDLLISFLQTKTTVHQEISFKTIGSFKVAYRCVTSRVVSTTQVENASGD
jgi:hypothetical protein